MSDRPVTHPTPLVRGLSWFLMVLGGLVAVLALIGIIADLSFPSNFPGLGAILMLPLVAEGVCAFLVGRRALRGQPRSWGLLAGIAAVVTVSILLFHPFLAWSQEPWVYVAVAVVWVVLPLAAVVTAISPRTNPAG